MPAFPFSPGSQLATNLGMNWNQLAHFLIFLLKKSILSLSLPSCSAFCNSHSFAVTRRTGGDHAAFVRPHAAPRPLSVAGSRCFACT